MLRSLFHTFLEKEYMDGGHTITYLLLTKKRSGTHRKRLGAVKQRDDGH